MKQLTKEEIIEIIDRFVNEYGLWPQFKSFVESQGYTVQELGIKDED